MKKNSKATGGIFLLIGVIILLFQLGVLGYELINALFVFWPLFIIVIGIDIAFKNRTVKLISWFVAISIILIFSVFGSSFEFYRQHSFNLNQTETVELNTNNYRYFDETKPNIGRIEISSFSQKIGIKSTDEAELIAEKSLDFQVENSRNQTLYSCDTFSVNQSEIGGVAPLYLSTDKLWLLDFSSANVNVTVDDKDLNIAKLQCSAAEVDVNYQYDGLMDTVLNIDAFKSNLNLYLPKDAQFSISVDGVYKNIQIDGKVIDQNNYYTRKFENAENKLTISIDALKTNVNVIYQDD